MTLRSFIFWPHLVAGLTAGLIVLVMSVTGVALTYERQMVAWSDASFRSAPPTAGAPRLPIEDLLARVRQARPDLAISAVTVAAAADAPIALSAGQRTVYADAYSGAVLGEGSQGVRRFMSAAKAWHRFLAVEGGNRAIARGVTGWSNLLFLFIVGSGIYLWLPRKWSWQRVRSVALFKTGLRGKARDFNWHNTIGVWSAIPLFIVVFSAVPISFPWANALVYRAVGEPVPAAGGGRDGGAAENAGRGRGATEGGARSRGGRSGEPREARGSDAGPYEGLNLRWAAAEQTVPGWQTINMRLPASATAPVVFAIDRGNGGQPQLRSTLTLERRSGTVISNQVFADQTTGRRLRSLMRFAHTGEVLGIPGQTVAGLATAGAVVLVWTGFALSLRRCRSWLARRRQAAAPRDVRSSAAA